jgi:hypothetical protein
MANYAARPSAPGAGGLCYYFRLANMSEPQRPPVLVSVLLGREYVALAARCLPRLRQFSERPVQFVVHDDGSLTADDAAWVTDALSPARFIRKPEADAFVREKLARYPHCRDYRERHPLGLKLFDLPLLAVGRRHLCDSDLLFTRPFRADALWDESRFPYIFLQGEGDAYCLHALEMMRLQVETRGRLRLRSRVNTGWVTVDGAAYDLDFIEYILARPYFAAAVAKTNLWLFEQTLYALLGARYGCGVLAPGEIVNASSPRFRPADIAAFSAVHFTTQYRGALDLSLAALEQSPPRPSTQLEVRPAPAYKWAAGLLAIVQTALRSRIRRSPR